MEMFGSDELNGMMHTPSDFVMDGQGNIDAIAELNKALTAGEGIVTAGTAGGAALRVQSLESTLKVVDFQEKHVRAWKMIPKKKAMSVAEEYTLLKDYGEAGDAFVPEIATPGVVDDTYERLVKNVRFMAVTKEVSLAQLMSRTIGGHLEALQARNGTRTLLQRLEWHLFESNSTKNPLAWDGILKQVEDWVTANPADAACIMDLRGQPVTPETFEEAAATIVQHYGNADHAFCPVAVYSDFAKQLMPEERFLMGQGAAKNQFGLNVTNFQSQSGGVIQMHQCPLLNYRRLCPTAGAGHNAPAAPVVAVAPASNANTQLDAETYSYRVVARGQNGVSAPSTVVSQAVNGAQDAVLTINEPAGAVYFEIYRANLADANLYLLDTVACSGTGVVEYTDDGEWIAGCSRAYVGDMDQDQVIAFHRLTDLLKMDLAQLGTAKRFMMLIYGVPIVYIPRRFVVLKNIGRYVAP